MQTYLVNFLLDRQLAESGKRQRQEKRNSAVENRKRLPKRTFDLVGHSLQRGGVSHSPMPGQPMTAHWGVADPAAVQGTPGEIERAFRDAYMILDRRISLFLSLPLSTLGQLAIKKEIDRIGLQ